jgi:hypothetical protein
MFHWDNKATLVIKSTDPSDAGKYKCEITNQLGKVDTACVVTVHSKYA